MKVHHLNCGTMDSPGTPIVCHVLLVETDNGLVLVDSGLRPSGLRGSHAGSARPAACCGPRFDVEETAARQVEALGFRRDDVRHIITTHFDIDHIGGLADFPDAQVHVTAAEALGAMRPPTRMEKFRFRSAQWAHGPKIVEHEPDGEKWRGFAAAKELDAIAPGIVLVSLPGHSRGHACVAVDAGHRWVLHCGDAFYYEGTIDGRSTVPSLMRAVGDDDRVRPKGDARQPCPARGAVCASGPGSADRLGARPEVAGERDRHGV